MRSTAKKSRGYTLLEVTIALALWMLLSLGVFLVWQHTVVASRTLLSRQNAYENARVAVDGLITNIQMANDITLTTDADGILIQFNLTQHDRPDEPFRFFFEINPTTPARRHRLGFGTPSNAFADNIAMVRIVYIDSSRMVISVTTDCPDPITLEGSVDVRYKNVIIAQFEG